jgi:hypothetical protein
MAVKIVFGGTRFEKIPEMNLRRIAFVGTRFEKIPEGDLRGSSRMGIPADGVEEDLFQVLRGGPEVGDGALADEIPPVDDPDPCADLLGDLEDVG